MLIGFCNDFVIYSIFGDVDIDILNNTIVDNIICSPLEGRLTIELQIKSKVINKPKRWGEYEHVVLVIDFFCLQDICIEKPMELCNIECVKIIKDMNSYHISFDQNQKTCMDFHYVEARVQRVIPMKYNVEFKRYEVSHLY